MSDAHYFGSSLFFYFLFRLLEDVWIRLLFLIGVYRLVG